MKEPESSGLIRHFYLWDVNTSNQPKCAFLIWGGGGGINHCQKVFWISWVSQLKTLINFGFDIATGLMKIEVDALSEIWTVRFHWQTQIGGAVHLTFPFVIYQNGLALYNCFLNFSQHENADMLQPSVLQITFTTIMKG